MSIHFILRGVAAAGAVALAACSGGKDRVAENASVEGDSFAIENVRVFDGDAVIEKATVIVDGGLVKSVGAERAEGVPAIDGAGMTVLPGLIDAHVHAFTDDALVDALRFGVSTELDHFTAIDFVNAKKEKRDGMAATAEADLFSAGTMVTAPGGHGTQFGLPIPTITAPEEAEAFVAARLAEGSDWIKIAYEPSTPNLNSVSKETLLAVVAAAKAQGALVVVHISTLEGVSDAVEAGADGLVHINGDQAIPGALIAEMASKGMFVIPTLAIIHAIGGEPTGAALAEDALIAPYLSASQRESVLQSFGAPPQWSQRFNPEIARANAKALLDAGVPILAGTDAPNPGTAYGVSMMAELDLLVQAGLSPVEALRAATSAPARAFKLDGRGALKPGARADLLLIDGDPTADVGATRKIARIFKNGREVERVRQDVKDEGVAKAPLEAGLISDFETDLSSAFGVSWEATTDQRVGGASVATHARVEPGAEGSAGAMRVEGTISTKFLFPWSGAGLFYSTDFTKGYDLSDYSKMTFRARGSERELTAMLFTATSRQRPAVANFTVNGEWAMVELALGDFRGAETAEVFGLAITAGRPEGEFWFEIDDVRLE